MENRDVFVGTPYRSEPNAEWNQASTWNAYYTQLFADSQRHARIAHREVRLLEEMLKAAGELPPSKSPALFLDAGCGISLIPHMAAYWGFQVTAIDSSDVAIEYARARHPDEAALARCVQILDPCPDAPDQFQLVDDPTRSLQHLRSLKAPGGSVGYRQCDWFSSELTLATFDVIYCRNALRGSLKPYWRRSLVRFYELLAPGGVLLLENVNAIGIYDEVQELLGEVGFSRITDAKPRVQSERYVVSKWPTG